MKTLSIFWGSVLIAWAAAGVSFWQDPVTIGFATVFAIIGLFAVVAGITIE